MKDPKHIAELIVRLDQAHDAMIEQLFDACVEAKVANPAAFAMSILRETRDELKQNLQG